MTEVTPEALVHGLEALGRGDLSLADALGMQRQVLDLLLDKALGLAKYGKHDQAEAELVRLSSVDGHSPMPPFALGALRAERKHYAPAVEAYLEAESRAERARMRPLEGRIALCRGHAAMMLGDKDGARAALHVAASRGDPAIAADAAKLIQVLEG
jgi:tetratricopeptide (TPR) repeat protein